MKEDFSFEFNGFKYSKNGIEYPNKYKLPLHFFKYYSISENSLNSFINEYLYFSHPNQLNDIIDSSESILDFSDLSEEDYNGFLKYLSNELNFDEKKHFSFNQAKALQFDDLRKAIYFIRFSNLGILSLTENPFNKLMMAHYTNERGFILEFNPNEILKYLFSMYGSGNVKFFPMNYVEKIKPINFSKVIIKTQNIENDIIINEVNYNIPIFYITNIKDNAWKYEKEWRILLQKKSMGGFLRPIDFVKNLRKDYESRKIVYNGDCLNRVILAPMFFNNDTFISEDLKQENINHYTLNLEKLSKNNTLDSFRLFLKKLSSSEMKDKVYIQNLGFSEIGYERVCHKLERIKFSKDVFSFFIDLEKYISFGK